jgi:hypothetical protein
MAIACSDGVLREPSRVADSHEVTKKTGKGYNVAGLNDDRLRRGGLRSRPCGRRFGPRVEADRRMLTIFFVSSCFRVM